MWWVYVVVVVLFVLAIYGFASLAGLQTRVLSRRTTRTAEDLYDQYADSPRKQRRYAREHGGTWSDDDPSDQSPLLGPRPQPPPGRQSRS
ncbi:MAG TPA: hypothetical protein VMI33_24190 [Streptosporangiaceae bacterium]|nr:hypothetical protein [Streptosporangiaceae bacterium]